MTTKPTFTPAQVIQQLTTSWGNTDHQRGWYNSTVTFSIGDGATNFPPRSGESNGITQMTATEANAALYAFSLWQDLIPLNLVQTTSSGANITLNFSSTTNDGASPPGQAAYTSPNLQTLNGQPDEMLGQQVWIGTKFQADFDPKTNKIVTPVDDSYYYLGSYTLDTMIHEIGHSLGLSHPDNYDASSGQPLSYDNNATFTEDTRQYSIMSYFGEYKKGVGWTTADDGKSNIGTDFYPQTPMRDDILAIQALYGPNFNTRSGDTHYGFNADSTVKNSVYDFSFNPQPILTIWDGGGNDTLDCSGTSATQRIDLHAGAYSSVVGLKDNVAIAYNCTIENAIGGSGNDTILGNAAANVLNGGSGGNDNLQGSGGNDTFFFTAKSLTASDKVSGGTGFDTLLLTTGGTVSVGGVTSVEIYDLSSGAANHITLTNANFSGTASNAITIDGGSKGDTFSDSSVTGTHRTVVDGGNGHNTFIGGTGLDTFIGGSSTDLFEFSAAKLGTSDVVNGGGGTDELKMTTSGLIKTSGVVGVETYMLSGSAANTLTLTTTNFSGVTGETITVVGGSDGNTLSTSSVAASDLAVLKGGSGADILLAGHQATLTGGAGVDRFEFATPGTTSAPANVEITDFAHGVDMLVFRDAGFNLGVDDGRGTSTPQKINSFLLSTRTDGTLSSTSSRFSYTGTGHLYYDADGSGSSSSRIMIGTLDHHPTLTASDIFFIS